MEKKISKSVFVVPAVYFILGLVMVIFPETTMRTFCLSLGAIAAVLGIVNLVTYFSRNVMDSLYRYDFVNGVMLILLGLLLIVKMELIINLIPIVLGAMILANGIMKLQHAIDLKRIEFSGWLYVLVFSLLCISVGAVCVFQPAFIMETLVILMGISFIFCSITDFITLFLMSKRVKEYAAKAADKAKEEALSEDSQEIIDDEPVESDDKTEEQENLHLTDEPEEEDTPEKETDAVIELPVSDTEETIIEPVAAYTEEADTAAADSETSEDNEKDSSTSNIDESIDNSVDSTDTTEEQDEDNSGERNETV